MCGDKPFRDDNWFLRLTSPQLVEEEYAGKIVGGVYPFLGFLVISFPLLGQSF